MSDPPAGLEVVCPACGGRSAVEPANRLHSYWGCPFCKASNPLPAADAPVPARSPRRRGGTRAAAAIAVAGVILAALMEQSSLPRGEYRTTQGVTAALADRGLPCRTTGPVPAPEGAREAARCVIGASAAWIVTFASQARRNRYLASGPVETAVAGATWLILLDDRRLAARIAGAIGGRVVRSGETRPDRAPE